MDVGQQVGAHLFDEPVAAGEQLVFGEVPRPQRRQGAAQDACGLPRIRNHIRQQSRQSGEIEVWLATGFRDTERLLRVGAELVHVHGDACVGERRGIVRRKLRRLRPLQRFPIHMREKVALVIEQPPVVAFAGEDAREEDAPAKRRAPLHFHGHYIASRARRTRRTHQFAEVAHTFAGKSFAHFGDGFRHVLPVDEDMALIQRRAAFGKIFRLRLSEDAPNHLRQRRACGRLVEHRQHVGKGAIPAFLQRRLREDEPHGAGVRHQVMHGQFIFRAALLRHFALFRPERLMQKLPHVVRVNLARLSLVLARALHADEQDGSHVAMGFIPLAVGHRLQFRQLAVRGDERVFPVALPGVVQVQRELHHLLLLQSHTRRAVQHIALLLLRAVRRGREFEDEARVELRQRRAADGRERRVALVEDHRGTREAKHVAQALLHRWAAAPRAFGEVERAEIGHQLEQFLLRLEVILRREEAGIAPRVLKHLQDFRFLSCRRRHHHHEDAEVVFHIRLGESIAAPQQLHPPAAGAFQRHPVGMLAVGERLPRLRVNGVARHDPQHQPVSAAVVEPLQLLDAARGEIRLARAGGELEADIRHRTPDAIRTVQPRRNKERAAGILGLGQHAGSLVRVPRLAAPIHVRRLHLVLTRQLGELLRRVALRHERFEITREPLDRLFLIFEAFHGSLRLADSSSERPSQ